MTDLRRDFVDRMLLAQAGLISELTIEAERICHRYRLNSIVRNNEEHGINYLNGLLPTTIENNGSVPSIYWVKRIGRTKNTKIPIDKYLKGVTKETRQAPRRYPDKYLAKHTRTDSELEAAIACEAELDPIRRMVFFAGKAISVSRKIDKLATSSANHVDGQSAA